MLASLASIASLLLLAFAVSLDGFGVGITYGIRQIRIPPRSIWIISCCSGLVILLAMLVGRLLVRWVPPHAASTVGAAILIGIGFWALIQFARGKDAEPERADDQAGDPGASNIGTIANTAAQAADTVTNAEVEVGASNVNSAAAEAGSIGNAAAQAAGTLNNVSTVTANSIANPASEAVRPKADQAADDADSAPVRQRAVWTLEIRQWGLVIQILRTPAAADMDRSGTITVGEALLLGTALSLDAFGAGIGAAMVGFPPLITSATIAAAGGLFLWTGTRVGFRVAGWRWVRPLTVLPGLILIAMGLLKLL